MRCLTALFAGFFPRLATLLIWVARPVEFRAAFGGGLVLPVLGIFLLPLATLVYVILQSLGAGVSGWDWVWIGLAVALDVLYWGSLTYQNRDSIPGYKND
jgi:hypothetical protein